MLSYEHIFQHSCDRHDFGDRNYGKNTTTKGPHLKLDPTQKRRRRSIDGAVPQVGRLLWFRAAADLPVPVAKGQCS